jgi:CRP-like cAMP-binding protein
MDTEHNPFKDFTRVSESDWPVFSSCLVKRVFKKGELILACGKTENYLTFVEKGIVRFWTEQKEKEITFAFLFENSFMSAYDSFITQTPSSYNVEALVETILWSISHAALQELYNTTTAGNRIGRLAAEGLYIRKSKREISLLKDSAEQRYLNLFKENPHFLQHIPLKYLASYIGITPQALSRIRKRIY